MEPRKDVTAFALGDETAGPGGGIVDCQPWGYRGDLGGNPTQEGHMSAYNHVSYATNINLMCRRLIT
jgi:hypothetical protein